MYIPDMADKGKKTVIVADAHIHGGSLGKSDDFFKMLEWFGHFRHDVVFLGDVFELWIALPGYEDELHRRFIKWCDEALLKRSVGFIEGNHEYYISSERASHFSWVSDSSKLLDDGSMFAHGDLINVRDTKYRLMRSLVRNSVSKALLKSLSPVGPSIAERIRVSLKGTNMEHRRGLPGDLLESYAEDAGREGAKRLVVGHFHQKGGHVSKSGVEMTILPSWRDGGLVGLLDKASGRLEIHRWRDIVG